MTAINLRSFDLHDPAARLVAADALEEECRDDEASLLRGPAIVCVRRGRLERVGFATEALACAAARRRHMDGLNGGGQQCGPVELPDGTWAYWTRHDYFHPQRDPGEIVFRGAVVPLLSRQAEALVGRAALESVIGEGAVRDALHPDEYED